jgi:hypothetical protein
LGRPRLCSAQRRPGGRATRGTAVQADVMALRGRLGSAAGVLLLLLLLPVTGRANLRALGACLRRRRQLCWRAEPEQGQPRGARTHLAAARTGRPSAGRALSWPPSLLAHSLSPRPSALGQAALHRPVGALDASGLARTRQTSLAHPPPRAAGVADCQFAHGSIDRRPLLHVALASCVTLARPALGPPARPAAQHHRRPRHAVMYALISSDLLQAAHPRPLPGR